MLLNQTGSASAASCCACLLYHTRRGSSTYHARSGWDIHDAVYSRELLISNKANGYRDLIATIDLSTYRRIPWEDNVPFFLVSFQDPESREPLVVDPRSILKITTDRASARGYQCFAGVEWEVSRRSTRLFDLGTLTRFPVLQLQGCVAYAPICHANLNSSTETPETLAQKNFHNLTPLTPGSMLRNSSFSLSSNQTF